MLTAERLREVLEYDEATGKFRWRSTGTGRKNNGGAGCMQRGGYRMIEVEGKAYLEHRLAWLYMTGNVPNEIDHRDGDKANNAFVNLRECGRDQNIQNVGLTASNSSGFKGAFKRPCGRRWMARIRVHGRLVVLGDHDSAEGAARAYDAAAIQYFGQFAKTNKMLGLLA